MSFKSNSWLPDHFSYAAIQGELFSNSYNGWIAHTRGQAGAAPYPTLEDAFQALKDGHVAFAFIPTRNTIAQDVPAFMNQIRNNLGKIFIIDERVLHINHCVLGLPGAKLSEAHSILSHKVALGQCEKWISAHPGARRVEWYDTAGAAMEVARAGDTGQVAIAPREAAAPNGLEILAEGIQDKPENHTRFFVLSRSAFNHSNDDPRKFKTALLVNMKNHDRAKANYAADRLGAIFYEAGHGVVLKQSFSGDYFNMPTFYFEIQGKLNDKLKGILGREKTLISGYAEIGCFPEYNIDPVKKPNGVAHHKAAHIKPTAPV